MQALEASLIDYVVHKEYQYFVQNFLSNLKVAVALESQPVPADVPLEQLFSRRFRAAP